MSKKKDLRTLEEKAKDYDDDLCGVIEALKMNKKPPARYAEWSLNDVFDMRNFYHQIMNGKCKIAYNKLNYLWKQCGLVPNDIQEELFDMFLDNEHM